MIAEFYNWFWPVMAQANASGGVPYDKVGIIIGSIIVALVGGGVLGKKVSDSNKTHILNSPLDVRLKEEFVTRREFEKLELTMNTHISEIKGTVITSTTKMEGLFALTMQKVETQSAQMTTKVERQSRELREEIGKVASGAYAGRQKIWEQVNDQRDDISAIKATSDVAKEIGKLASALQPASPKAQAPNSHS